MKIKSNTERLGFNEVWEIMKRWDIGKYYPADKKGKIRFKGGMLYSGTTGTDVNLILDAVKKAEKKKKRKYDL